MLLDLERVLAGAQAVLRDAGVLDRCRILPGDFFREIPSGGDLYLLKAVLHNWDDGAAVEILRNCRHAMRPGARIVVVESLLEPSDPWRDNFLDLHMLVMHGGRERTADQIGHLLAGAGLRLDTVTGTAAGLSLLAGRTA